MNDFFSPRYSNRGRSKHQAFSLLEVAFALVIFVIGAIALLRIFPGGLSVLEDSGNRRIAAQMSQNVVTSYNSGDLASTTPDAIYHVDQSGGPNDGNWDDYPLSAFGLRRQKGTVPEGPDDFNSAKDALNHIRGERQGISNGFVYTNYVADRKVDLVRTSSVKNVSIRPDGVIDFRNAVYTDSQRADKPGLSFREPILNISSIVDENGVPVALNGDTSIVQRTTAQKTYTITFSLDDVSKAQGIASTVDLSSTNAATFNANGTDCTSANGTNTADAIQVQLTVPALTTTPQANQVVGYTFTTIPGVSVARASYTILVASDGTGAPAPVSGPLLPVRAPLGVRQTAGVKFYVSYNWTDDASVTPAVYKGVVDMPTVLPTDDTTDARVPYNVVAPAAVVADGNANITFKQPLGSINVAPDRVKLDLSGSTITFSDSDGTAVPINQLARVSLDYNVRGWDYIAEDVSQFGTPFSDSTAINTNTAEGLTQAGFMSNAGYSGGIPMSELREIRTRLPNLRGPIYIKGFYDQSTQPLDVPLFDLNSSTFPTGVTSTVTPHAYVRQKRTLGKQGRLYIPANVVNGTDMKALSHARVYYRSSDAWAQQVGVTAAHYLPYDLMRALPTADQENWREYFHGNDGYLYFHASEAGKTVECLYGTDPNSLSTSTIEISPDVLYVGSMPANVPAAFTTKKFPTVAGDARSGKFYLARSRDRIATGASIFDIRRPEGTSGISVRTLWLNNDRYAQEVAQ